MTVRRQAEVRQREKYHREKIQRMAEYAGLPEGNWVENDFLELAQKAGFESTHGWYMSILEEDIKNLERELLELNAKGSEYSIIAPEEYLESLEVHGDSREIDIDEFLESLEVDGDSRERDIEEVLESFDVHDDSGETDIDEILKSLNIHSDSTDSVSQKAVNDASSEPNPFDGLFESRNQEISDESIELQELRDALLNTRAELARERALNMQRDKEATTNPVVVQNITYNITDSSIVADEFGTVVGKNED